MTCLDTSTRPIRVAVIATDERVRTSLRHLLTSAGGTVVIDSYAAGPRPATSSPVVGTDTDVVVLDLDRATSQSYLDQLRGLRAGLPTVVLGNDRGAAEVARAAGASYLDKADVADQLLHAVVVTAGRDALRTTGRLDHTGTGAIVLVTLALFAGPWVWWFSRIAQDHGVISWHLPQGLALWTMLPLLVAALAVTGGRRAVTDLGRRITRVRVPGWTWAAALLAPVLVAVLAAAVTTALGRHVPAGEMLGLPGALAYLGYGTGLFLLTEEAGWRGALLPRLQHRMKPWQAALVLGVIWAGWHLPLLATSDAGDRGLPVAPFLLLVVATSVLISGLLNAAKGSVVVAALFHASFDASYSYLGVVGSEHSMIWAAAATTALAAIVLMVRTRGRLFLATGGLDADRPNLPTARTSKSGHLALQKETTV
jgi:membrane protease YdiL (CAAX protease family)